MAHVTTLQKVSGVLSHVFMMPQHEAAKHSLRGFEVGESIMSHLCCTAGGEAGTEVRQELESKRDALVANYAAKRDALVADILPEVLHSGKATSKRLFMRKSRGCPMAFSWDRR